MCEGVRPTLQRYLQKHESQQLPKVGLVYCLRGDINRLSLPSGCFMMFMRSQEQLFLDCTALDDTCNRKMIDLIRRGPFTCDF